MRIMNWYRITQQKKTTLTLVWRWKLNLSINSTRSQQCTIQNVDTIGGHDHFDVFGRFKAVQLI